MTSARAFASGTETGIDVPGTFCVDEARNSSSVLASQVRCAFIIAGVKVKPGSVPDCRPMTAASDGPKPCLPGSAEWQDAHWFSNAVLPAVASPCAKAWVPDSRMAEITIHFDF